MLKNAVIAMLAFAVALAGCEAIVRLYLPYNAPWYEQLIAEQQEWGSREYLNNSMGLRDREFGPDKQPSCRRIFILGDSFTWGWGVDNEEAVFPKQLEAMLNQESGIPGAGSVEVLNGGVPGSLTGQWLELLEKHGDDFNPDVVLAVFFLRDGTNVKSIDDFFDPIRKNIVERNRASLLYRHVRVFRLAKDYVDRMLVATAYSRSINRAYFGNTKQTAEWQRAQRNLLLIRQYAESRSAAMGLIIFPVLVELNESYPFNRVCNAIADFARENDIPVHSLLPAFLGMNGSDLWVSAYDQHPNEKAHRIAAESMLPFVLALLKQADTKPLSR